MFGWCYGIAISRMKEWRGSWWLPKRETVCYLVAMSWWASLACVVVLIYEDVGLVSL